MQKSLTAVNELSNKRLQKRQGYADCNIVFSFNQSESKKFNDPSFNGSTPTVVSYMSTPPSSQSISHPSSNHSNPNGVDKNPCFSLDDCNDRT